MSLSTAVGGTVEGRDPGSRCFTELERIASQAGPVTKPLVELQNGQIIPGPHEPPARTQQFNEGLAFWQKPVHVPRKPQLHQGIVLPERFLMFGWAGLCIPGASNLIRFDAHGNAAIAALHPLKAHLV